jgi:phosphohistidine phosphatase SixA
MSKSARSECDRRRSQMTSRMESSIQPNLSAVARLSRRTRTTDEVLVPTARRSRQTLDPVINCLANYETRDGLE